MTDRIRATRRASAGLRGVPDLAGAVLVVLSLMACSAEAPVSADGVYVPEAGDAWQTRSSEQLGMNAAKLQEAVWYALAQGSPTATPSGRRPASPSLPPCPELASFSAHQNGASNTE
jgi:hypothetical protein